MIKKQLQSHVQTTFNFKNKVLYNYIEITVAYLYRNGNPIHANLDRHMNLNNLIHQQLIVIFSSTALFHNFSVTKLLGTLLKYIKVKKTNCKLVERYQNN